MLELDDDDYALLGFGDRTQLYESAEWLRASDYRRKQLLRAWTKYAKTPKGKEARRRYLETEKGKAANRRGSLSYYYRNKEAMKEKARKWREAHPGYMAKKAREYREQARQGL